MLDSLTKKMGFSKKKKKNLKEWNTITQACPQHDTNVSTL